MKDPCRAQKLYITYKNRYKFQKTSEREVNLPEFDFKLAEFMGALAGDGHITDVNNTYRIEFTLSGTEDQYYAYFIADLFRELFHVEPKVYKRDCSNRIDVQVHSKEIYEFIEGFFPTGKKESLNVPEWVEGEEMTASYLRGLIDTDGSLFFAKRGMYEKNSYPVIELKMNDKGFLDQVETLLDSLDIGYYRSSDIKIQLNGKSKIESWMSKIGFSNPNRSSRYYVWRVQNYCPPSTTLQERLEILGY